MKRRRNPRKRCLDLAGMPSKTKKAKEDVTIIPEKTFEILESEHTFQSVTSEAATQTMFDKYVLGSKIETILLRNEAKMQSKTNKNSKQEINSMSPESILASRKRSKFFLGLFPDQFDALYNFLGPAKFQLKYWHSDIKDNLNASGEIKKNRTRRFNAKEELFLTLLKLRRGFAHQTIAYMYGVSVSLISSIFITWIQFIYLHLKEIKFLMFPSRDILSESLPPVFKSFKNVRCLIDCTEFFCQTPRDYARQGNVYSSYKHHTTFKALIAVTPNGSACFISDLYEGSVDDVTITAKCGILNHIEPGDLLLVDKGFTIQDLLYEKQATIKIPAFLGSRPRLTKEEEIETKRIAKARIHVERFNERLKKFLLVGRTIPLSLTPIASQMVYVACCLVNFQQPLCK